jgi:adenosylcobinamide-GDP ribazoletransferase
MIEGLTRSISMFTIIPVRDRTDLRPGEGITALLWLPIVGAATGALAALPAAAIRHWAPHASLLGAVLAVAGLALMTRGLHLDGLADTADGLGSRAPAARALEIMRQPDIGPFGVVSLVLILAMNISALAAVSGGAWAPVGALAIAAATGRVAAVRAAMRGVRSARASGFGAVVADGVGTAAAWIWTVVVLGFGAGVAAALLAPIAWVVAAQVVALVGAHLFRRHVVRRLGGITGDVFGSLIESATAVTLVGIALR